MDPTIRNRAAAWLFLGAILIGGATAAAYYYSRGADTVPEPQSAAVQPVAPPQEAPNTDKPASATVAAAPESELAPPRFDVLRVEPDGSTVVAGTAPAGSSVRLIANGTEIAKGMAGVGGDFAIVLDKPLNKGDYELTLEAVDGQGKAVASKETGIVSVPASGSELMAMVTEEGKASRVLQAPVMETPAATPEASAVAVEPPAASMEKPADGQSTEMAKVEPDSASQPAEQPEPAAAMPFESQPVLVQAVDVDGDRMFIAGTGEPKRIVNVYLDEVLLGSTGIAEGGTFLLETTKTLEPGTYTIRADMLTADGTAVERRASVQLAHEAQIAAAEPPAEQLEQKEMAQADTVEKPAEASSGETMATTAGGEQKEVPMTGTVEARPAEKPADTMAAGESAQSPAAQTQGETAPAAPAEMAKSEPDATTQMAAKQPETVIETGASVIIRRGDNLWRISRRMLGRGINYTVIYEANRDQIKNPNLIFPGQVFDVPGGESENSG